MAGEKEKNGDLYAVLGLKKECSEADLKNAYKKLALVIRVPIFQFSLSLSPPSSPPAIEQIAGKFG